MDTRLSKYGAFFGRSADFVRNPQSGVTPAVSVARFPPTAAGFFRRFFMPVHDRWVYITYGMSEVEMQIPAQEASVYPSRIELLAYCAGAYVGAYDGQDLVSALLQGLVVMPFQTAAFFGPMHTASLEQPLCPGSEMSAFFFAVPEGVEMRRLCSCTPKAQLVVSVIPISASERALAVEHGSERLVELFERQGCIKLTILSLRGTSGERTEERGNQ